MIKSMLLLFCLFVLNSPVWAQQTVNDCPIQPFTRCPDVDLSGIDLSNANLQGAYLQGADLSGSNLMNANFIDAYLFEANMDGANITNANFSKAIWPDGRTCGYDSIGLCK